MVFNNNLLLGAAGAGGAGYTIGQSIRFNDDDSAYLSRTPGSAGDRKTWTFSSWVKRANLFNGSVPQIIFSAANGSTLDFIMQFGQSDDTLRISDYFSGSASNLITTQLFRDPSAWYHFVLQYDTTQATSSDRMKLYVNGTQVTAFGTASYPSLNYDSAVNNNLAHNISRGAYSANGYFDGYQAEINFIDGTALDPTSFGETSDDGVWVPKAYTGSYGTNGFYITGANSADLGADDSGNSNDFTSSGLTSADQMLDTPTDNFAVLNYIQQNATGLSDGNLQFTTSGTGTHKLMSSTIAVSSGKWYAEAACNATLGSNARIGIIPDDNVNFTGSDAHVGDDANSFAYVDNGQKESNNTQSAYGASYANGDVIGIALNLNDDEITFYKNGVSQGVISITASTEYRFAASQYNSGGMLFNFGQSAFTYTPPTGFNNALSTANLDDPTIADPSAHFQTTVYTGNGTAIGSGGLEVNQSRNSTFQPDFAWIKNRTTSGNEHDLYDAVRGATKVIFSSTVGAEATVTEGLVSFDSDGFTVGNRGEVNTSGNSMAAWQWKANGSGSSNTDGSITSTVSADTTSGFSIATYTGNGTSGATFGHGLGVAPKMVIVKERSPGGNNWMVGHDSVGWTKYLALDAAQAAITSSARWNNTAPSSTVVTLGNDTGINASGATYLAYCFAEVEGFSKISSFEGNSNADGPFVYTGFKPAFILTKNMDTADQWGIRDAVRNPYNVTDKLLNPNAATAETTSSTGYIDILSNGFKPRSSDSNINTQTIIYMAFAESPFKTATAR